MDSFDFHTLLMKQKKYLPKSVCYAFYPSRIAISTVKAVILGVCFEVIDDQEDFDINDKYGWMHWDDG